MIRAVVAAVALAAQGPCAGKLDDAADRAVEDSTLACYTLVEGARSKLEGYCAELWSVTYDWIERWHTEQLLRYDELVELDAAELARLDQIAATLEQLDARLANLEAGGCP